MPTSAPTSPQLAVYAKLLCLLMVVICGAAAPMEEKVRLFNEKTKGFMEASRKGPFVSARNVTFSKFTNLTIRSTNDIGVVELVFADLSPHRRLCMDKNGKLKGMKKLSTKRRQPGCLFRECVDGNYFFYLTTHARPRLVGFHGRDQFNPLGPPRCCDVTRGPDGEDGEHLVPDAAGRYTCQRRRAPHSQVDYFFFLKKRRDNATLAERIPAHNHHKGGHNRDRVAVSTSTTTVEPELYVPRGRGVDAADLPHARRTHQPQHHRHRGTSAAPRTTTEATRHHHKHQRQHQRQQHRQLQQQQLEQQQPQQQQQPHRTRHHHHLTPLTSRPAVRVRHRKVVSPYQQDASTNLLPWD